LARRLHVRTKSRRSTSTISAFLGFVLTGLTVYPAALCLFNTAMQDTFKEEEPPTIKIVSEASIWEGDASSDRVADQITDEAENPDINYVVLGSRKRSPSGKAILGSVAQLVLIDTSTPVVIVEEIG
jgi:nucleotide-binding universal stress UspA family protein